MKKMILSMMLAAGTLSTWASDGYATEALAQDAVVEAPNFTLKDMHGKPLSLKSLRGKYVVIDFWGSWCPWCIKGFPKMKEYYTKYKGKLEILGVDCNDSKADWLEAVEEHDLPWKHVYCPEGSKVLEDYGVQAFPSKVIVDPQGNVIESIEGEDPKFYSLLDKLLK